MVSHRSLDPVKLTITVSDCSHEGPASQKCRPRLVPSNASPSFAFLVLLCSPYKTSCSSLSTTKNQRGGVEEMAQHLTALPALPGT